MEFRTEKAATADAIVPLHARLTDVVADFKTVRDAINGNGADPTQNTNLMAWALTQAFTLVSATRDANEAITTGNVVWPDGATGVFTATVLSTAFPGAIDGWKATYVRGTQSYTVTQPTVTRDAAGAVINQPAITIAVTAP